MAGILFLQGNSQVRDLAHLRVWFLIQCRLKVASALFLPFQPAQSMWGWHITMFKVMSYFVAFQAKVTEELAAATAQVSHLHLKMTAHQKKETELQVQLTESMKEADLLRAQLAQLQAELSGMPLWRGLGLWPSERRNYTISFLSVHLTEVSWRLWRMKPKIKVNQYKPTWLFDINDNKRTDHPFSGH